MLMYFRFLLTVLLAFFRKKHSLGHKSFTRFLVLPWDSEFTLMNAGRFYSFMELGEHDHNIRWGFFQTALKKKWWVVCSAQCVVFKKSIKVFNRFKLSSEIIGWDEKYFYWKHIFYRPTGDKAAIGYSKVAVRNNKGPVLPPEALSAMGATDKVKVVPSDIVERLKAPPEIHE